MFNKKNKQNGFPDYEEQKQLRFEIIRELDIIILNWNPGFVTDKAESSEYSERSEVILNKLKDARATLDDMFLPRWDHRIIDYYREIKAQLTKINKYVSYSTGADILSGAADKIAQSVELWKNL